MLEFLFSSLGIPFCPLCVDCSYTSGCHNIPHIFGDWMVFIYSDCLGLSCSSFPVLHCQVVLQIQVSQVFSRDITCHDYLL